jgi:outer membrane protein insertion porin family
MKTKLNKFIFSLFACFFYISFAQAEIVNSIQIIGNKRVSNETIKVYGDIALNKDYDAAGLNEILNNLYSTNFFKNVEINLSKGILKINLEEFPIINELVILGEDSNKYTEEIKKIISSKSKDSFIKNNLSKDINLIKQLYASLGYNFVEVEAKVREIDSSSLDLVFDIKKGQVTKISKITFTGDKKVREKRLRDIIASEENKFWKFISRNTKFSENLVQLDKRLLQNYYKSLGYYDVNVVSNSAELKKEGGIELIYSIEAGKRYIIKKINTNVDPVFDKNIFYPLEKEYKKIVGSFYSPFKVKDLLDEIDELIAINNLQFVEHNVQEIIDEDSISIKLNIFEGEKILVERINITGNNITNETVIRGELIMDEGDPFTKLNLDKSMANIKSRNIFLTAEQEVIDGSEKNLKIINIKVEEKPTGEISAGAGIGTDGGSIAFNVTENNWLGEGKNIGFDVELTQDSLTGTVNYTDPNYDLLGNSLNYYLSSSDNSKPDSGFKNTVFEAGVGTSFEQYKNVFANLGLSASHDDLETTAGASNSLIQQSGTFNEIAGNYGFTFDNRDRRFMPTAGSISSFNQSLPIYADRSFIANTVSSSIYKSFTENVIGAGKIYFSSINGLGSDDVRLNKRRNLSTKRLRGFKRGKVGPKDNLDHVGGNYAAAINFEANLPKLLPESTKTDIGLFLDFANLWGVDYDDTIDDSNKIRSSTGAAASWLSPLGPMTFTLSTNLSKASTDRTESFNFNLGTTF